MATYLLTWTTYGTWLHGDARESVSMPNNTPGMPRERANTRLHESLAKRMSEPPFVLDDGQRAVVAEAIRRHCEFRGWTLHALNVRTNHVHIVCSADVPPEKAMGEFKAWASRALHGEVLAQTHIWTRHGSTRWLNTQSSFERAMQYVLHEQ